MKTQILASLIVIGLAAAAVGGGFTGAFFSDMENSTGNTIAAGVLDLKVNDKDDPAVGPVVTLSDLKPSQWQYAPVKLTIHDNPGKLWKHIRKINESTGIVSEPECTDQGGLWVAATGQAPAYCNWRGNTDNNDLFPATEFDLTANGTVIISPNDHISLDDASSCWIPLGQFGAKGQTTDVMVNESFHLKDTTGNWAQGDINTFQEEFLATQINAPNPLPPNSQYPRVWNADLKMCVPCGSELGTACA